MHYQLPPPCYPKCYLFFIPSLFFFNNLLFYQYLLIFNLYLSISISTCLLRLPTYVYRPTSTYLRLYIYEIAADPGAGNALVNN